MPTINHYPVVIHQRLGINPEGATVVIHPPALVAVPLVQRPLVERQPGMRGRI